MDMLQEIIIKTRRVPITLGPTGKGESVARQLDVALMSAGFKLSKDLLEHLSSQHPAVATDLAKTILGAVKELVGDHVQHNVYFPTSLKMSRTPSHFGGRKFFACSSWVTRAMGAISTPIRR